MKRFFLSIIIMIVFAFVIMGLITILNILRYKSDITQCKSNLYQLSSALSLYRGDYGKAVFYPNENGTAFLAKLYILGIIDDPSIFLCPATADSNDNGRLLSKASEGDMQNSCSYAARKNRNQKKYPGFYMFYGCTMTTVVCDDIEQPKGENHGSEILFLFSNGIVDKFISEEYVKELRDPLTN